MVASGPFRFGFCGMPQERSSYIKETSNPDPSDNRESDSGVLDVEPA